MLDPKPPFVHRHGLRRGAHRRGGRGRAGAPPGRGGGGDPRLRAAHDRAGRPGPCRRRPVGDRHPGDAVLRRARPRPRQPDAAGPRPLHPQQGPLRRGAVQHAGAARLHPGGSAGQLHGAAVGAERPPEPAQGAGGGGQHRPARPRPADRRRLRHRGAAVATRPGAPSSCSATASCRRAATGRRRCPPAIAGWTTSPRSSTATGCSRAPAPRTPTGWSRWPTSGAPSAGRWSSWTATTTRALWAAFTAAPAGKPRCVIARTIKGKGVSFMEDRVEWHHKVPSPAQIEQALAEAGAR